MEVGNMNKLTKYFINEDNIKSSHAFLIGNITYQQCKEELEQIINKYFFKCHTYIESNPDIYYLDNEQNSVTKEQIKILLQNLSSTSQIHDIKLYIISGVEN